jgi:carbamoyl-phosphate synthase large subunit
MKVLLSSASRKIPLLRAMERAALCVDANSEVVAGDIDPNVLASHAAKNFWLMPRAIGENVVAIIDGCRERGINVILPTRDGELNFWARNAEAFLAAGIHVIVSSSKAVQRCIDKLEFSEFGQREGLPFIPSALDIAAFASPRFVVKERFGAGSVGVSLNVDRAQAVAAAARMVCPIFQPFIEGLEFSVDAWLDRSSKVKGLILRRRDNVLNGESQVTTTRRDAEIESRAAMVLERLGLCGPVVLQILVDKQRQLHVIECNARFGGASTASIAAGLDSLFWSLMEAAGRNLSDYPFQRVPGEVRQVRVPSDLHYYDSDF